MTTDEFLEIFARLAPQKSWVLLNRSKAIRSCDGECPVNYVENQMYHNGEIKEKESLGESEIWNVLDSATVVTAADTPPNWYSSDKTKEVRIELEKICNLN